MNEETLREELFVILAKLKEDFMTAVPGSEQQTAISKNIETITKLIHKDEEIGEDMEKSRVSQKLDERKFLEDARQRERENDIKEMQARFNSKWFNWPIVQTLLTVDVVALVSLMGMIINCKTDTPIINGIAQWIMKMLGAVR